MHILLHTSYNLDEINNMALAVLNILSQNSQKWILLLTGELGAGKTTFARHIIKNIIPDVGNIHSPSFPIMIPYDYSDKRLWHMDFYRLDSKNTQNPDNLLKNDIIDALDQNICIIEWPEMSPIDFSEYNNVYYVDIKIIDTDMRKLLIFLLTK